MASGNLVTKVHQLRRQLNSEQELLAAQQEELRKVLERGAAQIGTTGRSWESASTRGPADDGASRDAAADTQGSDAEHQQEIGLETGAWEQGGVEVRCADVVAEPITASSELDQGDIRRALREQREELAELRSRLAALEKSSRTVPEIRTQPATSATKSDVQRPSNSLSVSRVAAKSSVLQDKVEVRPRTALSPVGIARLGGGYPGRQPSDRRVIPMPVQLRQSSPTPQSVLSPGRFAMLPMSRAESPRPPERFDRHPISVQHLQPGAFEDITRRSLVSGATFLSRTPAVARGSSPRSAAGPIMMSRIPGQAPGPGWVMSPRTSSAQGPRPSSPSCSASRGAVQIPAQR